MNLCMKLRKIKIMRYNKSFETEWNNFNKTSKNSLFMFNRSFMEYHEDRFIDHSLLFYNENDKLIAILPMSEHGDELVSHGGLTYGGFIVNSDMKQHTVNDCFDSLIAYAKTAGFRDIYYKTIPHMYHEQPAEEDRYSLFVKGAHLEKVEASTVIDLEKPLKMPKGRKSQISRAKREGVDIKELDSLEAYNLFIELENTVLESRHETKAVHTGSELKLLHDRFPENVRLFVAMKDEAIVAGCVVFEYNNVIHTQYMAANELARQIGALDLTIATLISKYKENKKWLDFGISTEDGGKILNEGLISQKEGFGGRTNVYSMWKLVI